MLVMVQPSFTTQLALRPPLRGVCSRSVLREGPPESVTFVLLCRDSLGSPGWMLSSPQLCLMSLGVSFTRGGRKPV